MKDERNEMSAGHEKGNGEKDTQAKKKEGSKEKKETRRDEGNARKQSKQIQQAEDSLNGLKMTVGVLVSEFQHYLNTPWRQF